MIDFFVLNVGKLPKDHFDIVTGRAGSQLASVESFFLNLLLDFENRTIIVTIKTKMLIFFTSFLIELGRADTFGAVEQRVQG